MGHAPEAIHWLGRDPAMLSVNLPRRGVGLRNSRVAALQTKVASTRSRPAARLRFPAGGDPHRSRLLYTAGWRLTRFLTTVYFGRREAGAEHIPAEGSFIIASNHASFMDPPLVGSGCTRPISYLARETLFSNPVWGWILRSVGSVPVDRDGATGKGVKTILERLRSGDGIILFPEGTRSRDGALQPARAGVGLVVLKSDAPVVPARVFGTFEAFGRHRKFPRAKPVGVRYGPPLDFGPQRAEAAEAPRPRVKELYQQVSEEIMAAIARLGPP